MKRIIKKIVPSFVFSIYYRTYAYLSAVFYGFPSQKMIVIGVTGTKGKTSTINFIWSCLNAGGYKTGIISTANIRIGDKEQLNAYHMTMPGRFIIQKLMAKMVRDGCKYCIIETTSEGIKQYRHTGIVYDTLIFTNLFPEHLQSHGGSFENYKLTKAKIFRNLLNCHKKINNHNINRIIISNTDSEYGKFFLNHPADKIISFGIKNIADYRAENILTTEQGVTFNVHNTYFTTPILGTFNVYNILPAIIVSKIANIPNELIQKGLSALTVIPGRMEIISHNSDFTVIVDYAHERESLTNLLYTAKDIRKDSGRIIVLIGAEGGGRDKAKRPLMGEISAKLADYVIVTNVDPYDDDPIEILEDIARSAENNGKIRNENLFIIQDRLSGIKKALSLGQKNDIILITGKGAEQSMIIGNEVIPWDDRIIVKNELINLQKND
jgi:UDP-N-acetylmuramoyl-L-alanyl-D-glutamate--2,6-diaminopimelate ligase